MFEGTAVGAGTRSIDFGEASGNIEDWDVVSFEGLSEGVAIDLSSASVANDWDVTTTRIGADSNLNIPNNTIAFTNLTESNEADGWNGPGVYGSIDVYLPSGLVDLTGFYMRFEGTIESFELKNGFTGVRDSAIDYGVVFQPDDLLRLLDDGGLLAR